MTVGIIGGTGALDLFDSGGNRTVNTHFGPPSARPERIDINGVQAWFIARHGRPHRIPPHRINYRANIWALRDLGVRHVLAINAVGAVNPDIEPGALVLPDQIIDYTWGRPHTFSDGGSAPLRHVDFTAPFDGPARDALVVAGGDDILDGGVYAATQGPRLESAAEIRRLARDGCDLVGMTGMPEAALAREAGLDYACICVVANRAAGLDAAPLDIEAIHRVLDSALGRVPGVIRDAVGRLVSE